MEPIEQKNALFLEEKKFVFCPVAAEQRVQSAEQRMRFWLRIAVQEKIHVQEDEQLFERFYQKFRKRISRQSKDYVELLLLEGCISLVLDKVAKHVRENIRRTPATNILEVLGKELEAITKKCCVWMAAAKQEKVVFEEEEKILFRSQISVLDNLKGEHLNLDNIKEINKRRLIVIRRFIACTLIRRVYSRRISLLAQDCIEKFQGTEHETIALGIAKEALEGLSSGSDIAKLELDCQNVFELFKANIELLQEDPEKYHLLADLEVIHRQVEERIKSLVQRAKQDSQKLMRIEQLRQAIGHLLNTENDSEKLIIKTNDAINDLEKTLFGENPSLGCGFLSEK